MTETQKMNVWRHSWALDPDMCPCDVDFCDYVDESGISDQVIFHFGSGEHHIVGRRNFELDAPNHILSVTASEAEHAAFIRYIVDNPKASNFYKLLFIDIYTLSARILPTFDVVTLFHLCEFFREKTTQYTELDDRGLVDLFLSRLKPGGQILFYPGSVAADEMRSIVNENVAAGKLIFDNEYKSLMIYRRP